MYELDYDYDSMVAVKENVWVDAHSKEEMVAVKEEVIPHKVCPTCGKDKPLSEFHKSNKSPDGHRFSCKECYKNNVVRQAKAECNPVSGGNPELANFTPAELINELRYRGYRGKLTYTITKEINV